MKVGCVVMAAGRGVRFGGNKLLHPLAGTPLLCHVLRRLPRERFARLLAVVSSQAVADLCREEGVPFLLYGGGAQSDTIRLGIREMEGLDGCMFLMGDQPLCARRSMEGMLDAFAREPGCVVRLSFQGCGCSPVLFPSRYFPALAALTGERGGMAALRGQEADIRLVEAVGEYELWDSDTVQDLRRIEDCLTGEKTE